MRVSPELIEARTGVTRWARPFDAHLTDVFEVQGDIAGQVAGALHLALTDAARARLNAVPTRSFDAYAHYLRSRELRSGEFTPDALRAAIAELEAAIRLDSGFVGAWTDLAQVRIDAFRLGGLLVEDAETARATLERARALAPESPEVRAASGRYRHVIEGDFVAAPLGSGVSSSYVAYVLARIDVLAGDREGAVTRLEAIARRPGYVSRERMRIDRTLAPLRGDPGSRRS